MQRQPVTVIDALLPVPVTIGAARMYPVTLGALLLLDRLQSPFSEGGDYNSLDAIVAGYILSRRDYTEAVIEHAGGVLLDNAKEWAIINMVNAETAAGVVKGLLAQAHNSWADTKPPTDPGRITVESGDYDNGMGDALTILSQMCEWHKGWTVEYVLTRPLSVLFALHVAHRINKGHDWLEPTYKHRDADFDGLRETLEKMVGAG